MTTKRLWLTVLYVNRSRANIVVVLTFKFLSLSFRVLVQPVQSLVDRVVELLFVLLREFVRQTFLVVLKRILEVVQVALQAVLRVDAGLHLFVLLGKPEAQGFI